MKKITKKKQFRATLQKQYKYIEDALKSVNIPPHKIPTHEEVKQTLNEKGNIYAKSPNGNIDIIASDVYKQDAEKIIDVFNDCIKNQKYVYFKKAPDSNDKKSRHPNSKSNSRKH